jgi:hypothetical protein
MKNMYHIDITAGIICYDSHPAPRIADECHAPNAQQYFAMRGKQKPAAIAVRGWPFRSIYITHGTAENGLAVGWTK